MLPLTDGSDTVDLNYLLSRHQTALMQAEAAACSGARHSHRGMAAAYAVRIHDMQADSGAVGALNKPAQDPAASLTDTPVGES